MGAHVELDGFGWRHAGRRAWAVRGVDLRIERGERVLLLGASGAGKSTLLAALAGLLPADSGDQEGRVSIDGVPARAARARAGIVFQDPQTQLVMARVGDDVAFGLENRGVAPTQIWPRVHEALETVGFGYPLSRSTSALSGGEQQRLALAGVLALRPEVLLLDEPTANLDPAGATLVRHALARIGDDRSTTVILVEHRIAEVAPLIDRVIVLSPGGGVIADGAPDSVFAERGAALAEQGVWVPGHPDLRRRAAAAPGPVVLRGDAVGLRYPGALRPALAATDVSVRAGEALAVQGPNGSGKTTLALLLGGLREPTMGRVVAEVANLGGDRRAGSTLAGDGDPAPHRWRAGVLARRIGSVFQNPEHQFLTSRVADELALGLRRQQRGGEPVRATVDTLLTRLHLSHLAAANPFTLSGGEQRRLSVATALATSPRVLILDEPTFGQDRRTWVELVRLLASVRDEGGAVVTVTHDAAFVAALADRTILLNAAHNADTADTADAAAEP